MTPQDWLTLAIAILGVLHGPGGAWLLNTLTSKQRKP